MDGGEIQFAPQTWKPWLKPWLIGIYVGEPSFQGSLHGAGFRPSTVCSAGRSTCRRHLSVPTGPGGLREVTQVS